MGISFSGIGYGFNILSGIFTLMSLSSLVSGILIMLLASILYVKPKHHVILGVLIIIFSLISIVGFGGMLIGLILGIIGGAYAIKRSPILKPEPKPEPKPMFKPEFPLTPSSPQVVKEVIKEKETIKEVVKIRCPYCGNLYNETVDRCPYCGGKRVS